MNVLPIVMIILAFVVVHYTHSDLSLDCPIHSLQGEFVGDEADIEDLYKAIDFSNTRYKVICIIGPPGAGKSTLARHVAYEMKDKASICYNDLNDFTIGQFKQTLKKKIVGNESITLDDLKSWSYKQTHDILIFLDHCDKFINNHYQILKETFEEFLSYSRTIKFVTTSEQRMEHTDHIKYHYHYVQPLNVKHASELLELSAPSRLNEAQKKDIAEVTGGIPLALDILGSLFREYKDISPGYIIISMNEPNYSFIHLERMREVINISYSYLSVNQREVGRYLSHFTGSFDKHAIQSVLKYINSSITSEEQYHRFFFCTVNELMKRSLLEYDKNSERYFFHRLIKKFFFSKSDTLEKKKFDHIFQRYFGSVLCSANLIFKHDPKQALLILDRDWHNFNYYLTTLQTEPNLSNSDEYLYATQCLEKALSTEYFSSRFSSEDLIKPLESIVDLLAEFFLKDDDTLDLFVQLVLQLASATKHAMGQTPAAWQFRKRSYLIEKFSASTTGYMKFYRYFLEYESKLYNYDYIPCYIDEQSGEYKCSEMGYHFETQEAKDYIFSKVGRTAWQFTQSLKSIDGSMLLSHTNKHDYFFELGKIYDLESEYYDSSLYYNEALRNGTFEHTLTEVEILLYLESFYKINDKVILPKNIKSKLNSKIYFMMNQTMATVFKNRDLYKRYILYFCPKDYIGYTDDHLTFDQCVDLNELVLKSLSEIGSKSKLDEWHLMQSSLIADGLYHKGDFAKAVKIASYALNHTSTVKIYFSICSSFILSKSMCKLQNYSGAITEFSKTIDIIVHNDNKEDWLIKSFNRILRESCSYFIYLASFESLMKCIYYRPDVMFSLIFLYTASNTLLGTTHHLGK